GVMLDAADPGGFLWGEWQDWSPAAVREVADFGDDASALAIASSAGLDWRGARGYIVESATEIGRFIVVNRDPIPGRRFRISAGVNDADATGEREAQSYWPATFVMGQSMTYTVGVLADANGNTPDVVDDRDPAATDARALGDDGLSFVVAADRPEATIGHIRCDLQLPEGERDLRVTCSVVDGWDWGLPLFRGFLPEPESAEYVASIYGNGVLIPTTDLAPPSTWLRPFHQLDMPAIGVVSSAGDALCIFDDHDYSSGSLSPAMWDGEKRLGLILQGDNMKGERLPEYRFTWHFAGSGGYVGLAKRVREYCAAKGWVKTLREKREANPSIDLLLGAPDVWGDSSLEFAREAKAAGIDRLLINGGMTPEVIREINALGYLTGEYDQYVDVDETTDHIGDIDPLVDHIRIQADGERAKGWANLDGSHQWYSRCSETALMGAQHEIPSRLATHAFTARFLDVHTAMGLVECYSEDHPCDCTTDRENKIEMLQWIREQSVVVGGEHGRAWSAAVLDYQEGMMSHNPFFTWPAGHLVKVDSEEQIGERYLEWGINHERRVPFWELVFHDCVVSTWYWGDSVGYLDDVRPDLTDRKVAMTALYGTAPLFWATKLGLNFDEEGKPKFLEAYRNCCKIHEAVGYEEMLSHEYLSDDRSVQRTTFSDGTTVTVNFGEEPATVKSGGKRWTLPMNGIVADGPTIHQHIAIIDGTVETYIERPGYRFLEREEGIANHAGLKCEGPLTAQLVEPGRIRLHAQPTTLSASADMRSIDPDFRADTARVLFAGDDLTSRQEQFGRLREGRVRCSPIDGEWTVFDVVYGEATRASDLWVHFDPPMGHGPQVTQGDAFHQRVRVANVGQDGGRAMLRAYWDTQTPDRLIFSEQVEVDGGATKEVQVRADTSQVAGTRLLIVAAEVDGPEMVTSDNVVTHPVFVTPDFDRWPIRAQVQVGLGGIARPYPKVEARLDFTSFLDGAELDPSSVHVATIGEDGKPADLLFAQFE
ncbi:MAG TPA: glycoside hydrolase, partial [Armatimonadota bacterium]|nr:glycoside hydrolase [Armatimonadota bacterium]